MRDVLFWRRLLAKMVFHFGYSRCMHCKMPWWFAGPHEVSYMDAGEVRGLIFACEWCWPRIGPVLRGIYVLRLVSSWHKPIGEAFRIRELCWPQLSGKEKTHADPA